MAQAGNVNIERKPELTGDELVAVKELAALCNALEGLDLKLSLDPAPGNDPQVPRVFLAWANEAIVGFSALDGAGRRQAEVCGMVHPEHRRKGIGSSLLDAAVEEARRQGSERVLLICEDASEAGQGFVRRLRLTRDFTEYRMEVAAPPESPCEHLVLREADPHDAETIDGVVTTAFGDPPGSRLYDILADMATPSERFYLGFLDGEPVTALKVHYETPKAYIYGFGVVPQYRRQGHGREFAARIITQLMADGWAPIGLEVESDNTPAFALYRSLGFREITAYGYYVLELARV
ncbi:MAG TPA: GNAT family N-acetyltransferase [Ktedonobacterales bacterium]|jgi:ribosomal protein S18 acetylase RimI-like enzyme|nr:GNAT family N-acetyltransferase [Ktedonobacterales bacterium]